MAAEPSAVWHSNFANATRPIDRDEDGRLVLHTASMTGPLWTAKARSWWARKHMADLETRKMPGFVHHDPHDETPQLSMATLLSPTQDLPPREVYNKETRRRRMDRFKQPLIPLAERLKAEAEKKLFALGVPRTTKVAHECTLHHSRQQYEVYRDALLEFAAVGGFCTDVLCEVAAQYDDRVEKLKLLAAQDIHTKNELLRKETSIAKVRAHRNELKEREDAELSRIQRLNQRKVKESLKRKAEFEMPNPDGR